MIYAYTSDTHGYHKKLPEIKADVFLFGGDWTRGSTEKERDTRSFLNRVSQFDCKYKVAVAGNHDWFARVHLDKAKSLFDDYGVHFLLDNGLTLPDGTVIWGSPWTPKFCDWAFMHNRNSRQLAEKWEMIPNNVDILITHGPPFGILDLNIDDRVYCGCELLRKELDRIKPKMHLFGHIHEGYGMRETEDTVFINGSFCDRFERSFNKVVYFKYEEHEMKDVWVN